MVGKVRKPVAKKKTGHAATSKDAKAKTVAKKPVAKAKTQKTPVKKVSTPKTVSKPKSSSAKPSTPAKSNPTRKTKTAQAKPANNVVKPALKPVETHHIRNNVTPIKSAKPRAAATGLPQELANTDLTPYQIKQGEHYMNAQQREHFRKILLNWKQALMEEVDRVVSQMQNEAANFPDPNDRATQEEEFSLSLRVRDRERKLLKKIDEALNRLKEEEYGYCESCGVEIGVRRLEARPTATLCIDCKTLEEIKEKQNRGHE